MPDAAAPAARPVAGAGPRPVPRPRRAPATTAAAAVTAVRGRRGARHRAEPARRVAVLDRSLHGARRGHRPPARRALSPAPRGPPRRRGLGVPGTARRDGCRARRRSARIRTPPPSPRSSRRTSPSRGPSPARSAPPGRTPAVRARSLSSELWETFNTTYREMSARVRRRGPVRHDFFGWIRDRTAAYTGLVDSTMSRDDGWRFLLLGRSLERADMTARLLSARYGDSFGQHRVDDHAAQLLRVRGVPPHVPACGRGVVGGRVPARRPALPALGAPRAHDRGAAPRRPRSERGACRRRRRSASAARSDPGRARVPERRRCDARPPAVPRAAPTASAARCTAPSRAGTSGRPDVIEWSV